MISVLKFLASTLPLLTPTPATVTGKVTAFSFSRIATRILPQFLMRSVLLNFLTSVLFILLIRSAELYFQKRARQNRND